MNGNWWIGLSLMHTLFAREHNSIVDRLRVDYPAADGEWLFQKARLVNAALIAKIHTTEWTPALMNSPEGRLAMRGNWWGLLGEHFARAYGRFGEGEVLSGIPGSPADHHSAPYAMTEEFTAVYRMHSLIPDEFSFRRHQTDEEVLRADFFGVTRGKVRTEIYAKAALRGRALFASRPAIRARSCCTTSRTGMRKMPEAPLKRRSTAEDATVFIDLATTDILRDRERGVPRYCAFRRHLGMFVPKSFEELTDDPEWQKELRGGLRRGREGRPAGRDAGGKQGCPQRHAAGLRLLGHGVPHLHPAGLAPAEERPLLHRGFPPGGLYARRLRLGTGQQLPQRAGAAFPGSGGAFRRCAQRLLPLAQGRGEMTRRLRIPGLVDLDQDRRSRP